MDVTSALLNSVI
jgi:hypothetical protein